MSYLPTVQAHCPPEGDAEEGQHPTDEQERDNRATRLGEFTLNRGHRSDGGCLRCLVLQEEQAVVQFGDEGSERRLVGVLTGGSSYGITVPPVDTVSAISAGTACFSSETCGRVRSRIRFIRVSGLIP